MAGGLLLCFWLIAKAGRGPHWETTGLPGTSRRAPPSDADEPTGPSAIAWSSAMFLHLFHSSGKPQEEVNGSVERCTLTGRVVHPVRFYVIYASANITRLGALLQEAKT